MANNPTSMRYSFEPDLATMPENVRRAHRFAFNCILDLQNSVNSLKSQLTTVQNSASLSTKVATTSVKDPPLINNPEIGLTPTPVFGRGGVSPTGSSSVNSGTTAATNSSYAGGAYIAGVNVQGTATTYTLADSDYQGLIAWNTSSAISVSLNSAVKTNFGCSLMNIGSGLITVTPTSGTVNGGSSVTLQGGAFSVVFFDGANWWSMAFTGIVPQTFAPVAHEFLTGYNSATGVFSAAQPAFTDISGNIATSQGPSAAFSGTVALAKLTGGGANGSLTLVNGFVTAYTPPT